MSEANSYIFKHMNIMLVYSCINLKESVLYLKKVHTICINEYCIEKYLSKSRWGYYLFKIESLLKNLILVMIIQLNR